MKNKVPKNQITLSDVQKAADAGASKETLMELIRIGLEQALCAINLDK